MRPHLSLNVRNVPASVEFYQKVFGVAPQKQTTDYAKFDLTVPARLRRLRSMDLDQARRYSSLRQWCIIVRNTLPGGGRRWRKRWRQR